MPYIPKQDRDTYNSITYPIDMSQQIVTKGDLEYLIFKLMKKYMSTREQKYSTLHDCTYAAQHCADEFRRRYLDKREDLARQKNGDI